MLHTKAGYPTAPLQPYTLKRGGPSPDVYLPVTNTRFPISLSSKPLARLLLLPLCYGIRGVGRHILERSRGPRTQEFGKEQSQRAQGEAQELAEENFVHIMYYMGSELQPENNLLFLLFPY